MVRTEEPRSTIQLPVPVPWLSLRNECSEYFCGSVDPVFCNSAALLLHSVLRTERDAKLGRVTSTFKHDANSTQSTRQRNTDLPGELSVWDQTALVLKAVEPIHHVLVRLCSQVLFEAFLTNDGATLACLTW